MYHLALNILLKIHFFQKNRKVTITNIEDFHMLILSRNWITIYSIIGFLKIIIICKPVSLKAATFAFSQLIQTSLSSRTAGIQYYFRNTTWRSNMCIPDNVTATVSLETTRHHTKFSPRHPLCCRAVRHIPVTYIFHNEFAPLIPLRLFHLSPTPFLR